MKYSYIKYIALFAVLLSTSCEEVVELDLEEAAPKLVIDAEILWDKGTTGANQSISITTSTGYYNNTVPTVSGATVTVTNNTNGGTFNFTESADAGIYTCNNFVPVLNNNYTLTVLLDGNTYTATESFIPSPEISRIEQDDQGGFSADETEITFYYNDIPNEANYYLSEFNADVIIYPDYNVMDDEFYEDNEMSDDFSDEDLKSGDIVTMRLRGISEAFYNYMNLILESSGGNPFSTPPSTIRGNIINENDTSNFVLGYFRLSEADYRTYTVE